MAMFTTSSTPRAHRPSMLLALGVSLFGGGCVDALSGSNIQVDFGAATQVPANPGATPQPQQPGTDTYYSFYSVYETYQVDGDGNVVLDDDGDPIAIQSYLFEVQRF